MLTDYSASGLLKLQKTRACSAREILESCLSRIEACDPGVRAFVDIDVERAMRDAKRLDETPPTGLLHGIPIAVKESIDVAGLKCTWGTPVHATRVPVADAHSVALLRREGAVILGTTVATEYSIARSGPTRNPFDVTRTAGGSSSGSAAAVGANMVPLALATQTLGSIVRPSTYCGVFGLKPTFGRIDNAGMMPLAAPFDHVGPMARSLDDTALMARVLGIRELALEARAPARVLRVEGPFASRIEPATRFALDRAQQAFEVRGIPVEPLELPERFGGLQRCFEAIVFKCMADSHGADRDAHGEQMSDIFLSIVDRGREVSNAHYQDALREAAYFRQYLGSKLSVGTVILAPATDGIAPKAGDLTGSQMLQSLWSVAGLPTLAVPCGFFEHMPVGVQLVSASGLESEVLAAGGCLADLSVVPADVLIAREKNLLAGAARPDVPFHSLQEQDVHLPS